MVCVCVCVYGWVWVCVCVCVCVCLCVCVWVGVGVGVGANREISSVAHFGSSYSVSACGWSEYWLSVFRMLRLLLQCLSEALVHLFIQMMDSWVWHVSLTYYLLVLKSRATYPPL